LMPQLLELTQLINKHGMSQVQIRRGRIEAGLDAQRLAALKLGDQLAFDQDLFRATPDQRQLLVNRLHFLTHTTRKKGLQTYKIARQIQAERGPPRRGPLDETGLPHGIFDYILPSYTYFQ